MNRGFSRLNRLRTTGEFRLVYREGCRKEQCGLKVYVRHGELGMTARLGVVMARRYGKAHDRNRVRRWVREWFRCGLGAEGSTGLDLIVQVRSATWAGESHGTFLCCIESLISQLGVCQNAHFKRGS